MIGEKIKERRLELHLTQEELADRMGYRGKSSINKIEKGTQDIPLSKVEEFAKVLRTTPSALMGWDSAALEPIDLPEMIPIPVLGRIHAGNPVLAQECVEDTPVYIPKDWTESGNVYRGLRVRGDSMTPKIQDGDRVIFRVQHDCESGDIVIARIDGDDATVKKIVKSSGSIILQPLNPSYSPLVFTGDASEPTLEILGIVVQLVRDL